MQPATLATANPIRARVYRNSLPPHPRVLCLGNALKETLGVRMACRSLELGVSLGGGRVAGAFCLSDGGDGFVDAYAGVVAMRRIRFVCPGPQGVLVFAEMLFDDDTRTCIIESAQAVGLRVVPQDRRSIMESGTAGLGMLIARAISLGAERIHVGLGGSATCDGGIGMLGRLEEELLGVKRDGGDLTAKHLFQPPAIRIRELRERLAAIELGVFCDVDNPLTGHLGTARVFAAQKGASEEEIGELDRAMEKWASQVESQSRRGLRDEEGAGAAGGLGFALAAIGGRLRSGAEAFCELISLEDRLRDCDGVITCEGRFDQTSFHGKAPWHAARLAAEMGCESLVAAGIADADAVERAATHRVRVIPFAQDLPRERRSAEAFTRLQQCVFHFIRNV